MKRMLITGSRGFIGSAIKAYACKRGWEVAGVDRDRVHQQTEHRYAQQAAEMQHYVDRVADAIKSFRPTALVHTAGPASVKASLQYPIEDFVGSVNVTLGVLECLRNLAPYCRLVLVSSAAVYGNPKRLPITESVECKPISPYGYHKLFSEHLLWEYVSVYGLSCCAARVFSAYGPGLRRQLFWDSCVKLMGSSPAEFWGTGDETRDFIHVRDVAAALEILASSASCHGEAYNVGYGEPVSIRQVVTELRAALGSDLPIHFNGKQRSGDPHHWQADISQIKRLGFEPRVELAVGLHEYADWFQHVARGKASRQ